MLTEEQLLEMAADLETDRVERKESLGDPDRVCEAICAFANDLPNHRLPGYVLIGVNDTGNAAGLNVNERLLNQLAGMRSDGNILPPPFLVVEKRDFQGGEIVVVETHPSEAPPVRFKGRVWIRVGARRAIATDEEERRLEERAVAAARTFDQRPCRQAKMEELALEPFEDYLNRSVSPESRERNERSTKDKLASLRLYDAGGDCPTNAGILLFGRDPLLFLPGAYVQFVRFAGSTLSDDVVSEKPISGDLSTQLRQLDELITIHISTARAPSEGLRHSDIPDYPLDALRELVINAVVHRTYESNAPVRISWFTDRVEIQNPGGLYGQVTPANFERVTDYRNPVIAGAMKILGYAERFGVGVARVKYSLAQNGNPTPDFRFEPTHVLVTVRKRP